MTTGNTQTKHITSIYPSIYPSTYLGPYGTKLKEDILFNIMFQSAIDNGEQPKPCHCYVDGIYSPDCTDCKTTEN